MERYCLVRRLGLGRGMVCRSLTVDVCVNHVINN